jgi:Tfp pilus assembly protein PilN
MPDRIGLELLADRVRAVALGRRGRAPRATAELPWDPARPELAVSELRARLGEASRIGVAVGLAFLDVQRVALPPARGEARRRMVALDPTRVFPLRESVVVALADDAPLVGNDAEGEPAFALSREQVRAWVSAFEAWGPVDSVEPAPAALARSLGLGPSADGEHRMPAAPGEEGAVQLRAGRVLQVRRAPRRDGGGQAPVDGPTLAADDPWRVAIGAALGADHAPAAVQLLPDDLTRAVARRRLAAVVRAGALCALAVVLALGAADRQRVRRANVLERALRAELPRAAPAASLQARLATLDVASRAGAQLTARRVDPLWVLATLGERIPPGAVVTALRLQGESWTVEGTARDAAALIPALTADPRLAEVRALSPSVRFVEGGTPVETFALAFRLGGGAR